MKWNSEISEGFNMTNGMRQGSLLSPYLFNVCMVDLTNHLNRTGVGCYIGNLSFNNLSYADDMVLLAPCGSVIYQLMRVCSEF